MGFDGILIGIFDRGCIGMLIAWGFGQISVGFWTSVTSRHEVVGIGFRLAIGLCCCVLCAWKFSQIHGNPVGFYSVDGTQWDVYEKCNCFIFNVL